MRYVKVYSPKHPGAVFIKKAGTASDFVAKVYPRQGDVSAEDLADQLIEALGELAGSVQAPRVTPVGTNIDVTA